MTALRQESILERQQEGVIEQGSEKMRIWENGKTRRIEYEKSGGL